MERDAYERRRQQLTKTATRNPDPRTRERASREAEQLRATYRRTRSTGGRS